MARKKDANWDIQVTAAGAANVDNAQLAVLMDIRDELKSLNRKLDCSNIQRMFGTIERIDKRLLKKINLKA